MDKIKKAFIFNCLIVFFELLAVSWMWMGIGLDGVVPLTASRLLMFKFFTIDSNILMGVVSLFAAINQYGVLKGKKECVRDGIYIWTLIGVTGVSLTMFITVFYLAPTSFGTGNFLNLFKYSNFFLHLVNPILSITVFIAFEKTKKIRFVHTLSALVPMLLYTVYYVTMTLLHTTDGVIESGYDWYGFFFLGFKSVFIVLPVIVLITFGISVLLWKLNRKNAD